MRTARSVRRQLQDLTLEIIQFAKTHKSLDEEPYMQWRIRDLEKRNEHLKRGAGTPE